MKFDLEIQIYTFVLFWTVMSWLGGIAYLKKGSWLISISLMLATMPFWIGVIWNKLHSSIQDFKRESEETFGNNTR